MMAIKSAWNFMLNCLSWNGIDRNRCEQLQFYRLPQFQCGARIRSHNFPTAAGAQERLQRNSQMKKSQNRDRFQFKKREVRKTPPAFIAAIKSRGNSAKWFSSEHFAIVFVVSANDNRQFLILLFSLFVYFAFHVFIEGHHWSLFAVHTAINATTECNKITLENCDWNFLFPWKKDSV